MISYNIKNIDIGTFLKHKMWGYGIIVKKYQRFTEYDINLKKYQKIKIYDMYNIYWIKIKKIGVWKFEHFQYEIENFYIY